MQSPTSTHVFPPEIGVARRGALHDAGAAFHALADTMPQMIWSTLPDGDHDYYNAQWYRFTGVPEGSTDGEGWAGMFHPDDQPEAWRRWNHSLATGAPYEVEYRLRRHDGIYRWVLGRALPIRDRAGRIERWIGTCTDIQDAKESAEQNEILSRELSHRIKNIFAVISALMGMTARADPRIAEPAKVLQERIAALGRAHEFVRPHSETSRPQAIDVTRIGRNEDHARPMIAREQFADHRSGRPIAQVHIDQRNIDRLRRQPHRRCSVVGDAHAVVAIVRQGIGHIHGHEGFIFDDKDAGWHN